jgi:hypothetical protein
MNHTPRNSTVGTSPLEGEVVQRRLDCAEQEGGFSELV